MAFLWLVAFLVFAIVEVSSVAFYAAFVAAGCLAAAAAAAAGLAPLGQGIVFATVSVLGIFAVRPSLMSYLSGRETSEVLSGAAGMLGQSAPVVDAIKGGGERGHVRVAGENWPALSSDGSPIAVGQRVLIVALRQATLVVEPINNGGPTPAAAEPRRPVRVQRPRR